GDALFWQERHREALRAFERAHAIAPNDVHALAGIGHACLCIATRSWQKPKARNALLLRASDSFARAMAIDPRNQVAIDGARFTAYSMALPGAPSLDLQAAIALALLAFGLSWLWRRPPALDTEAARAALAAVLPPFLFTRALVLLGFWLAPRLIAE